VAQISARTQTVLTEVFRGFIQFLDKCSSNTSAPHTTASFHIFYNSLFTVILQFDATKAPFTGHKCTTRMRLSALNVEAEQPPTRLYDVITQITTIFHQNKLQILANYIFSSSILVSSLLEVFDVTWQIGRMSPASSLSTSRVN